MKKTTFFVSLFLLAATIPARAQSTFPDVPDNHWAAQAVKKLVEAGIIEGRPSSGSTAASTRSAKAKQKPAPRIATSAAKTSIAKARATRKVVAQKQNTKPVQSKATRASTRTAATRRQGA